MNIPTMLLFFMMIALAIADDDGQYRPGKYGDEGKYIPGDEGRYVHDYYGDDGNYKSSGSSSFGQFARPISPKFESPFLNRFVVDTAASHLSPFSVPKFLPKPQPILQEQTSNYYKSYNRDASSKILRSDSEVLPDSYHYAYDTDNSISVAENGKLVNKNTKNEGIQANGFYEYVGPDNVKYRVDYLADENGFQPIGKHLPTPPPIPEEIARVLVNVGKK